MKKWFLGLAILGLIVPYPSFLMWVSEHGLDLRALLNAAFASRISTFAWLDVIISAMTLFSIVYCLRDYLSHIERLPIVAGSLLIGVSFGLPMCAYFVLNKSYLSQAHNERFALLVIIQSQYFHGA